MTPGPQAPAPRGAERALARRRQRYEQEVERLLDAALQVMRERDTASPGVTEILAVSGLSTNAFYRHFPTKDDLLLTLLERAHVATLDHLNRRMSACPDPADRVAEWVRALFSLLRTDELLTASRPFLLAHPRLLERFPAEITADFGQLTAPLAEAIEEARRAAGADTSTAGADARLAMQHVFGILIDRAALRLRPSAADIEAVVAYTERAVLPSPSARGTAHGQLTERAGYQ
jgi:AcrR family transcriptional regulator